MIVATCPVQNFDVTAGTCSEVVYVEQEGLLPSLSVENAMFLSGLVITCWALGFSFKIVRKYLFR